FLSQDDNPPRSVGKPLEHSLVLLTCAGTGLRALTLSLTSVEACRRANPHLAPRIPYFGINHHEAMPRSALRATQRPVPAFRRRGDYALSEIPRRSGEPSATGAGVILSDDVLRNPTPVGDLLALGAGPLPNGAVLLTIHRLRPPTPGRGARRRHGNPADLGPRLDVRLERFPQLGCVLRRQ